jgi:hypothetical protein
VGFEPQTTSRSCDFELKNGSGFCLQGFIAGASYGGLEIKKALMNVDVVV